MNKTVQFNGGVSNIESNTNKVQEITEDSTATQYPSAKAVKNALKRYVSLDDNYEFVFDGGDASGEIDIGFVIEDVISSESDNPVKNKVIKKYIEDVAKATLLDAHPIGSLYWSSEPTEPSELFGGTWERIKDRFILAAGDEYVAGSDGGESEVVLKESHMPKHKHLQSLVGEVGEIFGEYGAAYTWQGPLNNRYLYGGEDLALPAGGDQPHNNMPPYITYYCWQRIA